MRYFKILLLSMISILECLDTKHTGKLIIQTKYYAHHCSFGTALLPVMKMR